MSRVSGSKGETMGTQARHDDDMPSEIDFSKGTRGKFFRPGAAINLPVYLEAEVQAFLSARATAKGIDMAQPVNELLKMDIEQLPYPARLLKN
jgi:hypothetical protein